MEHTIATHVRPVLALFLVAVSVSGCSAAAKSTATGQATAGQATAAASAPASAAPSADAAASSAAAAASNSVGALLGRLAAGLVPSAAATAPPTPNVCALLSAAKASSIVGVGYRSAVPGPGVCTYRNSRPMTVRITAGPGVASWTADLARLRQDAHGRAAQPVSGLGPHAAGAGADLEVQAGGRLIEVSGADPGSPTGVFTKAVTVAKAVIAALH